MPQVDKVMVAYDEKYVGHEFRNPNAYFRLAFRTLSPRIGENLLDIGCARGGFLRLASQHQIKCYGLDLSPVAVKEARERAALAQIIAGNAENLAFGDESFDNVTMLSTLEHLLHPDQGLAEVRRVLKWGGKVLIIVPNSYYLPDIIWQVWRSGHGPNHKQIVERFATVQEWRVFIESAGLKVRRIVKYNFPWPWTRGDWEWYRTNPRRWLGLIASPFIPFNFSNSFLYLCEKEAGTRDQVFVPPPWPAPPKLVDLE